jgi:uncharacterized protein YciI
VFVCVTRYLQTLAGEESHIHAHWRYLDEGLAAGQLVCSGPQVPRTGGVLVLNLPHRDDAARFMEADPLVRAGFVSYELIEFEATRTALGSRSASPCFDRSD